MAAEPMTTTLMEQDIEEAFRGALLDVLLEMVRTGEYAKVDWDSSWQVGAVTDDEWQDLIDRLRIAYGQLQELARGFNQWDATTMGGAFALVGHCAYHLGEIRQGLGVLRG